MTKKEVTDLSYRVLGCAIRVHQELGPGLLESVYEKCFVRELEIQGLSITQQLLVPLYYKGVEVETNFRLDLLVNDLIIVELKAIDALLPVHEAQLYSYMKLLSKPQGLLINFNVTSIVDTMKPLVNEIFSSLPD